MRPGRQPQEGDQAAASEGDRDPPGSAPHGAARARGRGGRAAQLRERALEAAADETVQLRADAHGEIARLLEQGRLEAATAALEQRATAEAEARALLAEAELKVSRIRPRRGSRGRTDRDQIVADAMQEAATIRSTATDEVAGFLRRLDDERARLLKPRRRGGAGGQRRARPSATDAARRATRPSRSLTSRLVRCSTPRPRRVAASSTRVGRGQGHPRRSRRGRRGLGHRRRHLTAPDRSRAREVPRHSGRPGPTTQTTPGVDTAVSSPPSPRTTPDDPETVRWRAEGNLTTSTVAVAPAEAKPTNGVLANGTRTVPRPRTRRRNAATPGAATSSKVATSSKAATDTPAPPPKAKRRWRIFGRAS